MKAVFHSCIPYLFISTTFSGTTAVVALYRDDRVWVANAGDSRAVLGTQDREHLAEGSIVEVEPSGMVSQACTTSMFSQLSPLQIKVIILWSFVQRYGYNTEHPRRLEAHTATVDGPVRTIRGSLFRLGNISKALASICCCLPLHCFVVGATTKRATLDAAILNGRRVAAMLD